MPRAKTATQKLIDLSKAAPTPKALPAASNDFVQTLAAHPDEKAAIGILADQAALEFDVKSGGDITRQELECARFDQQTKELKSQLDTLKAQLKNTPQHVKCAPPIEGKKRGFLGMQLRDQVSVLLLSPVLMAVMILGASNIFSNLMASGEPVFLDNPFLAVSLSMLMPAATTAFKFISGFLKHAGSKKKYALFIYVLTVLVVALWSVAFALNYSGVAGGIDWDAMTGESADDTAFASLLVWSQMAAEILIGGSLFLALEEIFLKYNPEHFGANTEYEIVERSLKKYEAAYATLEKQRGKAHARLRAIQAKKSAHINKRLTDFMALRRRFQAQNPL